MDETWNLGDPVLLLDGGDLFGRRSRVEREQTRFLCEITGEFGYDAIGLGEWDLNFGRDFLEEMIADYKLPFTSANVRLAETGALFLPEYLLVERGGVTFGIVSVMDPAQQITTMAARDEAFVVDDPVTTLRDVLPRLRDAGAQNVILIAHLGDTLAQSVLHEVSGVDLCLVGHERRPYRTERVVDQTPFIASSYEARYIGRMRSRFSSDGKMQAFDIEVVEMGDNLADDPVMLERVEAFKVKLEEVRLAVRGEYQQTNGSADEQFLSERECRKCHQEIWDAMRQTTHMQAMGSLARKGQVESPECLVCHTTGYTWIGGYDDRPPANQLGNVQCEACHGYGTEHVRDGKWAARARNSCVTCHDAENSPEFDYDTYWSKIAH